MDEDAPHTMRWPRVFARVAGYMILAVVLYVLSAGPAGYLFDRRSPTADRALGTVYGPLIRTLDHTDHLDFLIAYIFWWYDLPGGPAERSIRQSTPLPASEEVN